MAQQSPAAIDGGAGAAASGSEEATTPGAGEGIPGMREALEETFKPLREDVAKQLRMVAAGIAPSGAAGGGGKKKKKKKGPAAQAAAAPAADAPAAAAAATATKKKKGSGTTSPAYPFDPPRFAQQKIPKGTGVEVDVARIDALLSGWGDPEALNVPDPETGQTALHMASARGRTQIVAMLLLKRAAVDVKDASGRTALYHACSNGAFDIVQQLLAAGADARTVNSYGNTSLHAAARNGHREVAELLVAIGLDPTAQNAKGQTPIDRAKDGLFADFLKGVHAETEKRRRARAARGQAEFETVAEFLERASKKKKGGRPKGR